MRAFPGRVLFQITSSLAGEPDTYIRIDNLSFRAEFKFSSKKFQEFRTLQQVWDKLRGNQQITILNMAAAGERVYVVMCCAGIEAPWFIVNQEQAKKALAGKIPLCNALSLERLSLRARDGRWTSGFDWGDDVQPKQTLAQKLLTLPKKGLLSPFFKRRPA